MTSILQIHVHIMYFINPAIVLLVQYTKLVSLKSATLEPLILCFNAQVIRKWRRGPTKAILEYI